jgi:hypothetical protein
VIWTEYWVDPGATDKNLTMRKLLDQAVPDIVFVDEGVRLRQNNPLWKCQGLKVFVALDNWRGKPPIDWWACETHILKHHAVGGVTNGEFKIHMATSIISGLKVSQNLGHATPALFRNCLDPTNTGIRCPPPSVQGTPPIWVKMKMGCYIGTEGVIT